jgi:hypothetical protein
MATYNGILLTKSPYYITEAGVAGFTSELDIRIWNGAFASEPTASNYTLEKQTLTSTETSVTLEVSKIINDEFDNLGDIYEQTGSAKTDSLWVNIKSFNGTVNRDDTWLAVNGYSDFLEGINFDLDKTTLISEKFIYHTEGIPIRLPVYVSGIDYANTVEFVLGGVVQSTIDYTSLIASTNSYDKVQYIDDATYSPGEVDGILVKNSVGGVIDSLTIVPMDCTKYVPYVVSFINKYGINQELTFGLVSKSSITVKKKSYNRQTLEINGGVPSYSTLKHQYKEYNSDVNESIVLNTNFIDESLNDTLGQLISSEYVWVTVGGVTSPVIVAT